MRHEARLGSTDEEGVSRRATLEASASNGNPTAIAALQGPDCPDVVRYLVGWARQLHGRSGFAMSSLLPLSYSTLADWSRLMDIEVEPREVDALMQLDAALLHPGEPVVEQDERPRDAWPKRKAG